MKSPIQQVMGARADTSFALMRVIANEEWVRPCGYRTDTWVRPYIIHHSPLSIHYSLLY